MYVCDIIGMSSFERDGDMCVSINQSINQLNNDQSSPEALHPSYLLIGDAEQVCAQFIERTVPVRYAIFHIFGHLCVCLLKAIGQENWVPSKLIVTARGHDAALRPPDKGDDIVTFLPAVEGEDALRVRALVVESREHRVHSGVTAFLEEMLAVGPGQASDGAYVVRIQRRVCESVYECIQSVSPYPPELHRDQNTRSQTWHTFWFWRR